MRTCAAVFYPIKKPGTDVNAGLAAILSVHATGSPPLPSARLACVAG